MKARPYTFSFDHEPCAWAVFPNNTRPLTEIASDPLNFQLLCETSIPSNEAFSVASKIHAALMEVWAASVKAWGVPTHTLKEMSITLRHTSSNATWQEVIRFQEKIQWISGDSMGDDCCDFYFIYSFLITAVVFAIYCVFLHIKSFKHVTKWKMVRKQNVIASQVDSDALHAFNTQAFLFLITFFS